MRKSGAKRPVHRIVARRGRETSFIGTSLPFLAATVEIRQIIVSNIRDDYPEFVDNRHPGASIAEAGRVTRASGLSWGWRRSRGEELRGRRRYPEWLTSGPRALNFQ